MAQDRMTVELPCEPICVYWMRAALGCSGSVVRLSDADTMGKAIYHMLEGKRCRRSRAELDRPYAESMTLDVSGLGAKRGSGRLSRWAVYSINTYLKTHFRETVYRHLAMQMRQRANFNLTRGIAEWLDMHGIPEDAASVDSIRRNFLNWRKRNSIYPVLHRGRFRKQKEFAPDFSQLKNGIRN